MTIQDVNKTLGSVIGCLQNIEANKADDIVEHYDCATDLVAIKNELVTQSSTDVTCGHCGLSYNSYTGFDSYYADRKRGNECLGCGFKLD